MAESQTARPARPTVVFSCPVCSAKLKTWADRKPFNCPKCNELIKVRSAPPVKPHRGIMFYLPAAILLIVAALVVWFRATPATSTTAVSIQPDPPRLYHQIFPLPFERSPQFDKLQSLSDEIYQLESGEKSLAIREKISSLERAKNLETGIVRGQLLDRYYFFWLCSVIDVRKTEYEETSVVSLLMDGRSDASHISLFCPTRMILDVEQRAGGLSSYSVYVIFLIDMRIDTRIGSRSVNGLGVENDVFEQYAYVVPHYTGILVAVDSLNEPWSVVPKHISMDGPIELGESLLDPVKDPNIFAHMKKVLAKPQEPVKHTGKKG